VPDWASAELSQKKGNKTQPGNRSTPFFHKFKGFLTSLGLQKGTFRPGRRFLVSSYLLIPLVR